MQDQGASTSTLSTNAITVLATAADNTYFKGVAFAPEESDYTALPVSLTLFNGRANTQGVKLDWETESEQNSDQVQVLHYIVPSKKIFH